jgi:hypothetical protein
MTKRERKRYDALLQRVTDIYSGALGGRWEDDRHFVGAEELSVIAPAIAECLIPDQVIWAREVGHWLSHLQTPDECADWLWKLFYRSEETE